MKRSTIPSIATDPTPRFSDIVTVRGAGHLDEADDAAANLAFRNWLVTRGTTLATIKDNQEEYAYWLGEYEADRRSQIVYSDQGSIWHALAHQWTTNRAQFVRWIVVGAVVVGLGLLIFWVVR